MNDRSGFSSSASRIATGARWPRRSPGCSGGERVEAYSAGCRPLGRVHPKAVEAMRELGYDLTAHQSKSLTDLPDVEFDVAVTMGCGDPDLPIRANVREDWNVPCPKAMHPEEFRAVRDIIGEKVKSLLERLSSDLVL